MICEKCHKRFKDKFIHKHHKFPIHLGGEDKDGICYICIKCHKAIHKYLDYLGYIKKEVILQFTDEWLNGKINRDRKKEFPPCPKCKDKNKCLSLREIWGEFVILSCIYCGYKEKNYDYLKYWLNKERKKISKDNQKIYLDFINKEDEYGNSI